MFFNGEIVSDAYLPLSKQAFHTVPVDFHYPDEEEYFVRILMISDVYFPRVNGVSTSIQTFMEQNRLLGNEVTLICPDYEGNDEIVHDLEENIIRLPSRHIFNDPEDRFIKTGVFADLKSKLKNSKFDIIHIQTPFVAHYLGLKLAEHLGVPCVETYHTFFEEYFQHYVPLVPKFMLKWMAKMLSSRQCNKLDAVVTPSAAMREALVNYGVKRPVNIIPTGIELKHFAGGEGQRFRSKHGIPESRPLLVYVGRVALEKNIGFLIEVLVEVKRELPNVLLIIAGEGPAQKTLEKLGHKLGVQDNLTFIGYMSRDNELLDCYKAGDAFVFCSKTETQGLVLLEALACGLPVVSTAVMGTRDVLKVEGGCLIAEDDVDDFSSKVVALLSNGKLQKILHEQAARYINEWTAEHFAREMHQFYTSVVRTKNRQRATTLQGAVRDTG